MIIGCGMEKRVCSAPSSVFSNPVRGVDTAAGRFSYKKEKFGEFLPKKVGIIPIVPREGLEK